jgi:rfaE bifunctional protein kinase chain/domain
MTTDQLLASFSKISALVVGDICLDRWCTYDPSLAEPSRETGMPRIAVTGTEVTPGAGGTVASNLVALNADRVAVLGVTGDDGFGFELMRALEKRGISTELMVMETSLPTFTYTKIINSQIGLEDRPRLDFISSKPMPEEVERKILNRLTSIAGGYDVIVVSDQAETSQGGVITSGVRRMLGELAARFPEKVLWVDSRIRMHLFRKVIVKANRQEAEAACVSLFGGVDYERLRQHLESRLLFVTQGAEGALVVSRGEEIRVETVPVDDPVDICGAGDSFSAGAALALAVTGSPVEAARIGNLVASVTIMKKGTGTASPEEVLAAERTVRR